MRLLLTTVWNHDGDLHQFLKDITTGYWGEEQFMEILGNGNEEVGEPIYNNWFENGDIETQNIIFTTLKNWINGSEADGDSSSACLLIINGKIVAGPERNYHIIKY